MIRTVEFRCHSEGQTRGFLSEKKIVLFATGIQYGKTTMGRERHKKFKFRFTAPDDNFIITAPTYKILEQSTLPAFLRGMDGLGIYRKSNRTFEMFGGGTTYIRSVDDPDSIVGITNVRHIWGDEAGLYSKYAWENIQGRAAFKNCPITLTTSPYSLNWVYKELIRPTLDGDRDDVELIQASSIDNPYFPKDEYYRQERVMDPRRFRMMFGGQWERMAGLVYDCFSEDENLVPSTPLPEGTIYVAGIDWGFTDPFVCLIHAVTPDNKHYQVSEFYKTGLTLPDIVKVLRAKQQLYNIARFYCGPDQPGHIEELCRNGLSAVPADNAIQLGVDRTYEMIKSRQLRFFRDVSPHTMDELDTYHYPEPEDLKPDQNAKEIVPVGQNDHAMDALRYCCVMTHRGVKYAKPTEPGAERRLTEAQRIERLKRPKRDNLETWG